MAKAKSYPVAKTAGIAAAKLLGDKRLAKAIYRMAPRLAGVKYGLCGLLLKKDDAYGAEYAAKQCVCGRALSFGRLSIYSDGNSAPRLVHIVCGRRAIEWSKLEMFGNGAIVLGPSFAPIKKIELRDMAPIWESYNGHLKVSDAEQAMVAIAETLAKLGTPRKVTSASAEKLGEAIAETVRRGYRNIETVVSDADSGL